MISDDELSEQMTYLAETDSACAERKANVARTEYLAKVAEALAFKLADGNNEERKADARTSSTVGDAWSKHFVAIQQYEEMRAKRERAILTVEVYRTESANRRRG
jgi:hypothetical protein